MTDSPDDRATTDDSSPDAVPSSDVQSSSDDTPTEDVDGSADDEFPDDGFPDDGSGNDADEFDDPPTYESSGSGLHARDVEVPMRVYKTVTVFSTLIAVLFVVAGFVILDRATNRAQLPLSQVDPVLAVLGIVVMLFGAATYAFGTRFRAAGMGSSKNDDDEVNDDG